MVGVNGVDATAYEPSKRFRTFVRALAPGDEVEVIGAVRDEPRTLNVEKLHVVTLARHVRKIANPQCERCRKRAKSLGRDSGFRCARCGARFPLVAAETAEVPRTLTAGWYEPPVGSRRHLSKPLKRGVPGDAACLSTLHRKVLPLPPCAMRE